ncbi:hypothetical protein ABK736_20355 [Klebsiella aerogenes]
MTKSTITREERVQALYDLKVGQVLSQADIENVKMLARAQLAAMDSEPVAWTWHHLKQWHVTNDEERARDLAWDGVKVEPLYRHAQPAPVVPEEKPIPNTLSMYAVDAVAAIAEVKGWNACRAAMLQASPVCTCPSGDGSLRWPCQVHPGNSPVIPDGSEHCPCCGKKLRRACSVEGCGGKHVAHGLCQKHYDMKRWEDPEQVRKFREAGKRYRRKTKSAAAAPQEVK